MFIIIHHFTAPLHEVDKYQQAHRDFFDYHFKQGLFILAGPTKPRQGQVLIASTKDRGLIEKVLKLDPFIMAEIAYYELIEFTPQCHVSALKEIIEKTEGKLC